MMRPILFAVVALAFAGAAQAATTQTLDKNDRKFLDEAATGNLAEVQMGALAQQRASSPDIKQFGERMITDHTKVNDQVKSLAQQKGVTLPTQVTSDEQKEIEKLTGLTGPAFDKEYINRMVKMHEKDVSNFKSRSTKAKDPDVKNLANQVLPTLQQHLDLAKSLQGQLKST